MSLVNDALKRAKQAQKNDSTAPRPGPQLRPVEPSQHPKRHGLGLPVAIFIIIALVALCVWQASRNTEPQKPEPAPTQPVAVVSKPPEPAVPVHETPPATPAATPVNQSSATNTVAIANPSKPAAPKLQALFFNPTRPSAVVNGKTVTVGGQVGEFRVAAIDQASVTLVSATQTNILTLE